MQHRKPFWVKHPHRGYEYKCTECGFNIWSAVEPEYDVPVCLECQWHAERPWIPRRKYNIK